MVKGLIVSGGNFGGNAAKSRQNFFNGRNSDGIVAQISNSVNSAAVVDFFASRVKTNQSSTINAWASSAHPKSLFKSNASRNDNFDQNQE